MPNITFNSISWIFSITLATIFLTLACHAAAPGSQANVIAILVFGKLSPLFFGMFSSIFSLLALSFSLNTPIGRPLTIYTTIIGAVLLFGTLLLQQTGMPAVAANAPAVSAAFLMLLRAIGVAILPPRGDRSGVAEASWSLGLSLGAAAAWWLLAGPASAVIVFATVQLLTWPHLIDGINAFADKVFRETALRAGVRDLAPSAFGEVARARDILIDKAALMSGPNLMVTNVVAFNNEPKTLLAVAASAEVQSDHPVAEALRQLAAQWHVDLKQPDRFEPAPGLGVVALLGGQTVVIGTTDLLKKLKIDSFTADAIARSLEADGKTVLRVAVGGRVVGVFGLEGTLRQDAGVAGMALRREGLVPWLNCGDSPKTRQALADMLGLELADEPQSGETGLNSPGRASTDSLPLVLTLSQDRHSLELRQARASTNAQQDTCAPIAVSDTDDIGAFPALKCLAMRRTLLAVHARRLLCALWALAGLCGALALVPLSAAPLLFLICLAILWAFARFSVADTINGTG